MCVCVCVCVCVAYLIKKRFGHIKEPSAAGVIFNLPTF